MLCFIPFIRIVLLLLYTTSNLLPNKIASALGNETDHSALLKFKESISNDPFGVLSSWNSSNHFCNWDGVTCGHRHQRVTVLNFTRYQLHGYISPYIGNLSFLRILLLGSNNFHGNVPLELGRLFRLQQISFTNNTLGGEFPISLTNCSQLRRLSLYGNQFSGEIPMQIGCLRKLEWLIVQKNNLTGKIPPSIGNLSSLTILVVGDNHMEGNIPNEIGLLKNLTDISLTFNKLSGRLPSSFFNLSSLTHFLIAGNNFNGSLPANMFLTLLSLIFIEMGQNQFSGPIPPSITNASRIQWLGISNNFLVGEVPSLGNLPDLSHIILSDNRLGSNSSNDLEFLKSLRNCTKLEVVAISINNFGGPLPNFIGNLSNQLTELYLGTNQLYGKIPPEIGNLENLILLSIVDSHLSGTIPTTFGKLLKMQELHLKSNKLSGEIPIAIGNMTQISFMDLSQNMLLGKIPLIIGNCRNLQTLDLSKNKLSGSIPSQVLELPSLSILLNLSHNSLSCNLPLEVGNLQMIDMLDVSENYLSGSIPATIGDCLSLEYLYLQGNSFNGSIPSSLASLKGIRHLDLSLNNLSGSIPKGLENISFLEWFNASFNKLEGEVPMHGIFKNVSAISLRGNGMLCGGVPQLQLPPCMPKPRKRKRHNVKLTLLIIICSIALFLLLLRVLTIYQLRKRQRKASTYSTISQLPRVSYQNLHHATAGFSVQNLIGTGSLGFVYKGSLESEESLVAIKVLNLQKKGAHKSFISECNVLRSIRHRNLVKILTCCSSMDQNGNEFKALVFEYMTNGSLEEWVHPTNENAEQPRTLKLERRLEIIIGIASALHYLHYECGQPIIHCDLKPSNVLLDGDMVAHVGDFGLAKLLSTIDVNNPKQSSSIGIKGTIGYAPPEYGMDSQVSIEGDMYSFGILVLEMLTGRRPTDELFKDGHNIHNFVKISLPNFILEIVDKKLISMENEHHHAATIKQGNNISEIPREMHPNVERCLFSLFNIGLSCSVESPRKRMNMKEVVMKLNKISKTSVVQGILV